MVIIQNRQINEDNINTPITISKPGNRLYGLDDGFVTEWQIPTQERPKPDAPAQIRDYINLPPNVYIG